MAVDSGTCFPRNRSEVLDPGGLVRDVLLVEGRRAGRLLVGEGALMALGGGCGIVGRCRGHVSEEGLVFGRRAADEIGGVPREDVGEVVFFLATVGDDLPVLVQLVVVILETARLGVPLVPARRDVARVVRTVAVQVLADQGGPVAVLLQAGGDRVFLQPLIAELLKASYWALVASHVVVVGVEAGEDSSPGGAAYRVAYEGLLEGGAPLGQQGVDLWHLLDGGEVQVVGENEDYVRLLSSRGLGIGFFLGWCKPHQANNEEGHRTRQEDHKKHSSPGRRPTTAPY